MRLVTPLPNGASNSLSHILSTPAPCVLQLLFPWGPQPEDKVKGWERSKGVVS